MGGESMRAWRWMDGWMEGGREDGGEGRRTRWRQLREGGRENLSVVGLQARRDFVAAGGHHHVHVELLDALH